MYPPEALFDFSTPLHLAIKANDSCFLKDSIS